MEPSRLVLLREHVGIEHEIEIRVRYQETDGQGRVHHANFLNYFEVGRTELLRAAGHSYRQLEEEEGLMLVSANIFGAGISASSQRASTSVNSTSPQQSINSRIARATTEQLLKKRGGGK